jgi:hypothetical protein
MPVVWSTGSLASIDLSILNKSIKPTHLPTKAGIARSQVKRVLQDGKGSRDMNGGEAAMIENPTAGLVGHADGLEAGSGPSSSSSSSFSPSRSKHSLGASSGPSGGGGDDADGDDDDAAANRRPVSAIPNYSEREEQVVRLSKRLLNIFYFCGTIFAGRSPRNLCI